ncbi:hypothetical protein M231_00477 [Tremella mesenterica]|uniref:Myb-like domain-containing protein n=1 Tax=Tremella mesenterica TaxID=5217 RepID=A0A4Q1BVH8_TREME|nr:uncharacterized protein TREMEDRAFT_63075 [Tremella mesenterica DSM 1558]EIW68607.1 hypothetical protein TREMEDRAFT_63075 [Tremella mesenterica DSM 1558]RXK42120.1 hypothetical protein M231_00477 [Tremella mesenterica]
MSRVTHPADIKPTFLSAKQEPYPTSSPPSSPMPQTPSGPSSNDRVDRKPRIVYQNVSDDETEKKPQITPTKRKAETPDTPRKKLAHRGGARVGAWTADEDWELFKMMHPRVHKPDWRAVGEAVGRDAKSCKNRYTIFGRKLEYMVKGAGGI